MAEAAERFSRRFVDPALDIEQTRMIGVRLERGRKTVRGHARRFDRLLHLHPEQVDVEEDLQHRLSLHVAAWRAERHFHLARRDRDRRTGRKPRTLAGRDAGRMIRVAPVLAAARRRNDAQLRDHRRVVGAVARGCREHIAVAVDNADMRGIEFRRRKGALRHQRCATRGASGGAVTRIAGWRHFRPGFFGTDQLATFSRVVTRQ